MQRKKLSGAITQLLGVAVEYGLIEISSCQIKKTVTGESQKNQKPSARESESVAVPKVPRKQV